MANLKSVGTAGAKATQEGLYAKWEVSAPLSEKESDMIMDLAALVTERPFPKVRPDVLTSELYGRIMGKTFGYSWHTSLFVNHQLNACVSPRIFRLVMF